MRGLACVLLSLLASAPAAAQLDSAALARLERPRVLAAAERYLREPPVTITAFPAPHSAGGPHDFSSDGDYWWPDPRSPDSPYVRRDGETNPHNLAEFAHLVGDPPQLSRIRRFFEDTLVAGQMAADGSFPRELARTKPYGYSLFQLDVMGTLARILDDWRFTTPDGRGMGRALAFMYPFIRDKRAWPKPADVMYYDAWPVRHPALLFGGLALHESRYVDLWKTLDPDPTLDEVIRNYPIRQPLLWLVRGAAP
jgi:hypothetical protein